MSKWAETTVYGTEKRVNLLQVWLLAGIPGLVIAAALFVGHARVRAVVGYLVLASLIGVFAVIPAGRSSAVAIGLVVVAAVAAGRGTHLDAEHQEHHRTRRRYTVAGDDQA